MMNNGTSGIHAVASEQRLLGYPDPSDQPTVNALASHGEPIADMELPWGRVIYPVGTVTLAVAVEDWMISHTAVPSRECRFDQGEKLLSAESRPSAPPGKPLFARDRRHQSLDLSAQPVVDGSEGAGTAEGAKVAGQAGGFRQPAGPAAG